MAGDGPKIISNYLDLGMLMDYWSPKRLNHHTESTSMLYAARECARVILEEGLDAGFARHETASRALRSGLKAMGLELFGDQNNSMTNVTGVLIPFRRLFPLLLPRAPAGRGGHRAGSPSSWL